MNALEQALRSNNEPVAFTYKNKAFLAATREMQPATNNMNRHSGNPDLITVYCLIRNSWRSLYISEIIL